MIIAENQLPLLLNGEGYLFTGLAAELRIQGISLHESTASHEKPVQQDSNVVISVHDWWNPVRDCALQKHFRMLDSIWLPVWADFSKLWIGPLVFPTEAGCLECVRAHQKRGDPHPEYDEASVSISKRMAQTGKVYPLIPGGAIRLLASFLREELIRLAAGKTLPRLRRHIYIWDMLSLRAEKHPFFPLPDCPECPSLPDDVPELAILSLQPRLKIRPDILRIHGRGDDLDGIVRDVVSSRLGIVRSLDYTVQDSLVTAAAPLPVPDSTRVEIGFGRATVVEQAKQIAVLEALERYAGLLPAGKRPILRTSYRELGDQAIDPRSLVLYSPEQYATERFPYAPFDEDTPYLWVWGYSLRRRQPVAVPEEFIYYGPLSTRHRSSQEPMLARELSNGCALGNCNEEAILHGLFEVLERDGFLLTWYAQQAPHRLDLETVRDQRILFLIDHLREQGYEIFVFDTTQEFGVPTVWVMAVATRDDIGIKTLSAAGCHLDPEKAIWGGLLEVAAGIPPFQQNYPSQRPKALALLENANDVHQVHEHALVYTLPEAFSRLQFLFAHSEPPVPLEEAFPSYRTREWHTDLTADLMAIVQKILQSGMDVLVFDQTSRELHELGLSAVRVVVPGMLPMAFGHQVRRYYGCPRLLRLLELQEESSSSEVAKSINPWPHPFP